MKEKQALIIVDVQNDFCSGGALPVPNGYEVIEVANYLTAQKYFDVKVFTQDWHPKDHCSFASNHLGAELFETIKLDNGVNQILDQILWPDHCIQETNGASFHLALDIKCDKIIQKGINSDVDSYSGFWDVICK